MKKLMYVLASSKLSNPLLSIGVAEISPNFDDEGKRDAKGENVVLGIFDRILFETTVNEEFAQKNDVFWREICPLNIDFDSYDMKELNSKGMFGYLEDKFNLTSCRNQAGFIGNLAELTGLNPAEFVTFLLLKIL